MGIRKRLELRRNFREHGAELGANVPSEMPGIEWNPIGGYFAVDSHSTDETFGFGIGDSTPEMERAMACGAAATQIFFDIATDLNGGRPVTLTDLGAAFEQMTTPEGIERVTEAILAVSERI